MSNNDDVVEQLASSKDLRCRTWDELKLLVHCKRMELIGRTAENYAALRQRMEEIRAAGTTADYIRSRFLQPGDLHDGFSFRANEFPYWLQPGVLHYVLWYDGADQPSDAAIDAFLARKVAEVFPGAEYVWANHMPQFHSVKDVFHVQVFVRTQ